LVNGVMSNNIARGIMTNGLDELSTGNIRWKITLIGAGNVATHLGQALARVAEVVQVVSRNIESAQRLSNLIGGDCIASSSLDEVKCGSDFYLIAVNDDSIKPIAESLPDYPGIWAHTSGSVPADVFAGYKTNYGVFYPLQTFTRDVKVDVSEIPFFIEGNSSVARQCLASLARMLSGRVEYADSIRRGRLHVSAVFACNYANLMWLIADELLKKDDLDITYMMPLLKETLKKLSNVSPREAMTGPARRGDREVIRKHIEMLAGDDRKIYKILADRILEEYSMNG